MEKKYIIIFILLLMFTLNAIAIPKFSDNNKKIPPDPIYKSTIMVPKGYILNTNVKEEINCENASVGDNIHVFLNNDFLYKGITIAPEGSLVIGKVVKKYNDNSCKLRIKFTNIITPSIKNIPISAVFLEENATGYISSLPNGKLFKDNNTDVIIKQPVTFIPDKSN